jgi:hypothetical protein
MVNTPVLLIAFNRPEMLQKVVDSLSVHRLSKLYAFVDNARDGNVDDINKIEMCKKIIDKINFCDEVITIYPEVNLGCGGGPFYAITTAFKNETKLIILEDDCVPSAAFPSFCEELLDRYENDQEVWMISGHNFSWNYDKLENSYVFSGYAHIGGWATWKRSWQQVNLSVDYYKPKLRESIQKRFPNRREQNFFFKEFSYNLNNPTYTGWGYQASLTFWENEGLSITPLRNLVSNIGTYGTHFSGEDRPFFNLPVDESYNIITHPVRIERDIEYDDFHFTNHWIRANRRPLEKRIYNYVRKRINRLMDNGLF